MLTIAFIGVHGIGKTTTARALAGLLGKKLVELEAIEYAVGLDAYHRQMLFTSSFVYEYLRNLSDAPVYTSHPLLVVAYNDYFLYGREKNVLNKFILSMRKPVDIMIYLKMTNIDTVIERIRSRYRVNVEEEAKPEYLEFIDKRVSELLEEYTYMYKRLIVVDGCLELDDRLNTILSEIG